MQVIDELEVARRGPYGGGLGHVSFAGGLDMALALRTMVVPTSARDALYAYPPPGGSGGGGSAYGGSGGGAGGNSAVGNSTRARREWAVHIQAGAGVVADSDPVAEWEETVSKAAALGRAVDLAEAAFVRGGGGGGV
jgi:anthranilate synthase component 1